MVDQCKQKNPLSRSGTHQGNRVPPGLQKDYFQVDERSLADLLVFAQRYSKEIRFFDTEQQDQTWEAFFNKDVSATLAGMMSIPVSSSRTFNLSLRTFLEKLNNHSDQLLINHFQLYLFQPLLLLQRFGEFISILPAQHEIKILTQRLIERDLLFALTQLSAFYKGAENVQLIADDKLLNLQDYNTDFASNDLRIQLPSRISELIVTEQLFSQLSISGPLFSGFSSATWTEFYASVIAYETPYLNANSVYEQIYNALNDNALNRAVKGIFQALQRIIDSTESYFQQSLEDNKHQPHYALWLCFLQLFKHNQGQINQFTERHLNFYYREILQIQRRKAQADQVHLLLELSKNTTQHLLPQGTLFKAGKDSEKAPVYYQLNEDFVANQATITQLKSLRIFQHHNVETAYASPITNSRDGQGQELLEEQPQWPVFGPEKFDLENTDFNARIGFAIADRQLFMREGARTLTVTVDLTGTIPNSIPFNAFKVKLTSDQGWLEISDDNAKVTSKVVSQQLVIKVQLDGSDPPVMPYDVKLHEENFITPYAVAKFECNTAPALTILKSVAFSSMALRVTANGLRNYSLQNELGVVDTNKPFLPFGITPAKNSYFTLGSSEFFSKPLENIQFDIQWESAFEEDANKFLLNVQHFSSGAWHDNDFDTFKIFSESNNDLILAISAEMSADNTQYSENILMNNKSTGGFVKFSLPGDFGHKEYNFLYTLALVDIAGQVALSKFDPPEQVVLSKLNLKDTDPKGGIQKLMVDNFAGKFKASDNNLPEEPYTPKIIYMTLSYACLAGEPQQFFYLHPFGFEEPELQDENTLFPDVSNAGELYLGIENLTPPQRLSMLFQAKEGTANPLKNEQTIIWEYLQGNDWSVIDTRFINDQTANLSGSGIISLAIPEKADTRHDVLPTGYHWLKMSVQENTDALNDLLAIDTQAVAVTFADQNNADDFLQRKLLPETISKLKISDSAIKKISQPAVSFSGKAKEADSHYYSRVSERLRHKDRAVTIWDYEYLILEQFPEIYKVRCINHTQLLRNDDDKIIADKELQPGHVLLVTVPYVHDSNLTDPLRPYTPKKTQVQIGQFIRSRTSPFVNLEVQNPKIEEVQTSFKAAFTEEIADTGFYEQLLNDALIHYLTPWAFNEGQEISFGGSWHKSSLINFIEELPYIHYIKDFQMYHKVDIELAKGEWEQLDTDIITATTARSILVSHKDHDIKTLVKEDG